MSNMTDGTKAGIAVGAAVGIFALAAIVVWTIICTRGRSSGLSQRRDKQRAKGTYEMEV